MNGYKRLAWKLRYRSRVSMFGLSAMLLVTISGCANSEPEPWYLGSWSVSDAEFPGMSAMGMTEAQEWFGLVASYRLDRVSFKDDSCHTPAYTTRKLSESDFYQEFRATFAALAIDQEEVTLVEVNCAGDWLAPGSVLIQVDEDNAYTTWDGVFFKLDKLNRQTN